MLFPKSLTAIAAATLLSFGTLAGAQASEAEGGYGSQHYLGYKVSKARLTIVNARIANQRRRIKRGLRSGRLNRREARRIRYALSDIRERRGRFMRDDKLSAHELRRLEAMLNANHRRIRRLATNRRYGGAYDGGGVKIPPGYYRYHRSAPRRTSHLNGFKRY